MGLQMGALSVRIASLRLWWRPGLACPRRARTLPRASAEKSESKKVARDFLCAVSTQSHPKRRFSVSPWALKNYVGAV